VLPDTGDGALGICRSHFHLGMITDGAHAVGDDASEEVLLRRRRQGCDYQQTFSLTLAGTHVHGGEWSVTIGEHRRIESVNGEWATPTAINTYPLRSTAAVFDDLQQGTAKYPGPQPMTAMSSALAVGAPASATIPAITVHVTGVAFGIARWDADTNGHTVVDLVPTYRFHAQVDGGSAYDIEVLALDPGSVTFTNPAPTPQPLPAGPTPAPSSPPAPAEP